MDDLTQSIKSDRKNLSKLFRALIYSGVLSYALILGAALLVSSYYTIVPDVVLLFINNIFTVFSIFLFALFARKIPSRRPCSQSQITAPKFLLFIISSIPLMFAGSLIGTAVSEGLGIMMGTEIENVVENFSRSYPIYLIFITTVIIAPLTEEFLYRKLIIDKISKHGIVFSALFSGITFGAFHGNFHQFFYASFLGMLLAVLYYNYGKLRYCILLHSVINLIGTLPLVFNSLDETSNPLLIYLSACYSLFYIVSIPLGIYIIVKSFALYTRKNPLLFSNGSLKLFEKNVGFILYIIYIFVMFAFSLI